MSRCSVLTTPFNRLLLNVFNTNTLDGHPKPFGAIRIADLVWDNLKKSLEDYDSNSYPLG